MLTLKPVRCLSVAALLLGLFLASALSAADPAPQETPQQRDQRMAWWRDARFGMFIHWGVYSVPAGVWKGKPIDSIGEWIMSTAKIPMSEYEKLAPQFNPVKFDAKQWVGIAKKAGMKYIVITSKHHDGFAMYDTKLTKWGIMSTPWKHDPMKDLAEECKKAGITLCFYHSIMDWNHPDYLPRREWDDRPAGEPNFDRYVAFMKGQLKELLTNYGPVGVVWFDGEWEPTWTQERGKDLYAYCRSLQPNTIVNNRVGKNRQGMQGLSTGDDIVGDFGTPEQEIPASGLPGVDWESCMTFNDTWGYKSNDNNWKSTETVLRNLIDIASKGGNYLLNVGPTSEGLIPQPSVDRLAEVGRWMDVNGEAIYGTTASPFKQLAWGRCTQKPGKLYLHVFDWPKGDLVVPGLKNKVNNAYLLADKSKTALKVGAVADGVSVKLPAEAPDKIATVVVLEIEGTPEVAEAPAAK